ncbi:M20/M25/M40 family metallo-hydrolase [Ruminococcus flavefaciens]|uniref:Peptidase M42 family protein n=1 Tax=Ruminococcus flavefaciens 007c TaxID=1341157 RepID=W7V1I0_RUMFL|nr:M20/M25/M40 family metallo-hydrolase [Ruminococcus flavefaciens]EWM54850.1 peptidase M42 family protein [Ruminococcus flavefaciens 007c]
MDLKQTVTSLSEAAGASGSENKAAELALSLLRGYCPDASVINGNVIGHFGVHREGLPSLVLDAHIDQVGFVVTYITDDGFIKVGNIGGIDRRLLPAQPVVIHGKRSVKGVICSVPPHLTDGGAEVLKWEDVAIDTGMTKVELEEAVAQGDSVTFDTSCRSLIGDRITGGALDDRCGVAAILYALDLLSGQSAAYNVTVIFSTQEEVGERGAKTGAFLIDPDIAIAVDVSFAYAIGEEENKCGYLGKGPMIGLSPSLSREISDNLISVAEASGIPYQKEVMNGLTSTNADRYSVNRSGAKACTVSIPLRNMHTPVEVIDLSDVEMTAKLLAEYIREGR